MEIHHSGRRPSICSFLCLQLMLCWPAGFYAWSLFAEPLTFARVVYLWIIIMWTYAHMEAKPEIKARSFSTVYTEIPGTKLTSFQFQTFDYVFNLDIISVCHSLCMRSTVNSRDYKSERVWEADDHVLVVLSKHPRSGRCKNRTTSGFP